MHHDQESAHRRNLKIVHIHGGEIHASKEPVRIHTLLGSCVAACLFDPTTYIGGMNHFLLPECNDGDDCSARYGIHAMELLINAMMTLGANRHELCAKIFGGGDVLHHHHPSSTIGKNNIRFVQNFLQTERIPILAHRIGGNYGLVIHLYSDTFDVFVRPIHMDQFNKIHTKEVVYQKKLTMDIANRDNKNIELF